MHKRHTTIPARVGAAVAGFALLLSLSAALAAGPPPAPSDPVNETIHGVNVADPYRNFEDLKSAETQAWLKAEGEYAAERLALIPGRDAMARRIEALADASGDVVRGLVRVRGDRIFCLKRGDGANLGRADAHLRRRRQRR